MSRQIKVLLILFISTIQFVFAQQGNIPLNTWRYHTSFNNSQTVVQAENNIYCGGEGGLFYFDKDHNSINKFSKLDGLSDLEVSALYYHQSTKSLIIGYKSGNIDVVRNNSIYNIPSIVIAGNITGSKTINVVSSYKYNALLACDFGVVVLDLSKLEVKETWLNIAENGSSLAANDIITIGDSVFIASNKGLYSSKFDNRNLMDFNSWGKIPIVDSLPNLSVSNLSQLNQKLIVSIDGNGVYAQRPNWQNVFQTSESIKTLVSNGNTTWLFTNGKLGSITAGDTLSTQISGVSQVNSLLIDQNDNTLLWMADGNDALVKYSLNTQQKQQFAPNAPLNNLVFNLKYVNEYVFHFSGAYGGTTEPKFISGNYSYFKNGEWSANYNPGGYGYFDIVSVAHNTSNGNYYFASDWNGLIEKNNDSFKSYDQNSTTCPIYANFGARVLDVYYDANADNLWFSNVAPISQPGVQKFKNGKCIGYNFPIFNLFFPAQIIADNSGNMWVRMLPRENNVGLIAFNDSKLNSGVPIYLNLQKGVGIGNLSDNTVNCMIKDRNGDLWFGTNNGVSVMYNPGSLLNNGITDASSPIVENRPLLFDQVATCIDVDGGNRKWIGTNNGIYLFSADGTQTIHYFNTDNSPLLSNSILSVSVDQSTGEVFIGTDKGIVSFREASTKGNDDSPEVFIFPNPVKTNYTGMVGFSGLATDAVVKITDINGRLVYEAKANGGTAQWNTRDYNGKKIEPGVYVILTSKSDGTSPAVGKLFVID